MLLSGVGEKGVELQFCIMYAVPNFLFKWSVFSVVAFSFGFWGLNINGDLVADVGGTWCFAFFDMGLAALCTNSQLDGYSQSS